jgi:hypothetical protein
MYALSCECVCHPDNDTGNLVTEPLSSNRRPLQFGYSFFQRYTTTCSDFDICMSQLTATYSISQHSKMYVHMFQMQMSYTSIIQDFHKRIQVFQIKIFTECNKLDKNKSCFTNNTVNISFLALLFYMNSLHNSYKRILTISCRHVTIWRDYRWSFGLDIGFIDPFTT